MPLWCRIDSRTHRNENYFTSDNQNNCYIFVEPKKKWIAIFRFDLNFFRFLFVCLQCICMVIYKCVHVYVYVVSIRFVMFRYVLIVVFVQFLTYLFNNSCFYLISFYFSSDYVFVYDHIFDFFFFFFEILASSLLKLKN